MGRDIAGLFIRSFFCLLSWGVLCGYLGVPGGWWLAGNLLVMTILLVSYRIEQQLRRSRPPLPKRRKRVGPPMEWID